MSRTDANRRRVLRSLGAAAAGAAGLAAGSAAAEDCYYEYQCVETICPLDEGGLTELRRECCETSDGTTCSDWEVSGCC